MEELGQKPKWRWDELLETTKKYFNLYPTVEFTDLYYEKYLVHSYTTNRHHHTLRHIEYMLKYVNDFNGLSHRDRCLLKWAIWFHDLVYDSKRDDNEKKSALRLVDFSRALEFKEEDIEVMKWLVLVTTHKGSPQTQLEDIICDLDLKELSDERFTMNTQEVRQEFSHLSDEEFFTGRVKFIDWMLNKEYIYHTDLYRESLETLARQNLLREKEFILKNKNG